MALNRADTYRVQFLARVKKFQNLSAERQKKIKPQLQRDYSRVASKMKSLLMPKLPH